MSRSRFIVVLLALLTLLAYSPAVRHGFSTFDDDDYVTENRAVQDGLTWTGVKWAFTTGYAGNWHPVTWLSHMTDCELFGLNAGAQHFVNVLFHAANTVLLLLLLLRLTGDLWPSAFVAALFAWHPLHVESVAWIAERKDVLSTFFALLALLAYTRYVSESKGQSPKSKVFYGLTLLLFALGLMSKPMLVTLPCVMLLLDYWPLQRFQDYKLNVATAGRLALEKWPFFLLAAISCVITFVVQHQGRMVVSLQEVPLPDRLANVPLAYIRYLLKVFWPAHLAIFYPLPKSFSPLTVAAAIAALAAVTAITWRKRKRHPHGLAGWLWFLGTLVPVIGLVQVGHTAMADRYTYFPSIGVFLVVAFGVRDLARRFQLPSAVVAGAAIAVLAGCLALTEKQLDCWRDDESLFSHAVKVIRDNEPALLSLGQLYETEGRPADALAQYRICLKLHPYRVKTYNAVARVFASTGRTNEALAALQAALEINPQDAPSHNQLGGLFADSGRTNEALGEFREAVRLNPRDAALHDNLGAMLAELGRLDEAMEQFAAAAQLDPYDWRTPFSKARALLKQGRDAEAVRCFQQTLQLDPDNLLALAYLAQVLASDEDPAVRDGQAALALASRANSLTGGTQPLMLDALGMACAELGHFDEAQKVTQAALRLTEAGGQTPAAAAIEQRLRLYQNHRPFRQSFRPTPKSE